MNQPSRIVKACALTSSLLLASTFVLYRSGAFDDVIDTSPRTALAASMPDSSARGADTADGGTDTIGWKPRFPGSKSMVPIIGRRDLGVIDTVEATDTVERREVLMGGSKSLAPIVPVEEDSTRSDKR